MDAVSVVIEVLSLAYKLYDALSEADQQKVRDNFVQGRVDLATDVGALKDAVAQMEADRAQAQAALAAERAAHQQTQAQLAELKAQHTALVASVDLAKPVS